MVHLTSAGLNVTRHSSSLESSVTHLVSSGSRVGSQPRLRGFNVALQSGFFGSSVGVHFTSSGSKVIWHLTSRGSNVTLQSGLFGSNVTHRESAGSLVGLQPALGSNVAAQSGSSGSNVSLQRGTSESNVTLH